MTQERERGKEPTAAAEQAASEEGLLVLAGRRTALPLPEALTTFRELVSADMEWADSRKTRFRRRSTWSKGLSLGLTALSTVVLGIPQIPFNASIALPMVAVVTLLGSLELFHNWRSRWILMEETRYRLNRLRDEIDYVLVTNPADQVTREQMDRFFADQQQIWADVSRQWVEFRRQGDTQQPGPISQATVR
ncbi:MULTISPECIES: SLATT domain-containing protein [Micromonospora]|uniref:SLATT domain-containing protein n=1 Tax=Micromonospora TaxID=1873 RepID=UPI0014099F1E|nr:MULTISPECIES: SLATT domain-containing protein [Micromonospora]NHO84408.1 SLATT domain-containing protein [Micromonospora sp. CMU55-4]WDP98159.1 SLATT domain-containing protein [Micromonospora chalcea]